MVLKKNVLTKEGYEKLVAELHNLKDIKMPAVIERIGDAKAMGDLSENFEYKAALEDKDFINTRISEIEGLLQDVEIMQEDSKKKKGSTVDYGSKVTVDIGDDKKYSFTIVGTGEIQAGDELKVSFESPIGIAVRGKKAGDVVKMRLANGRQEVKILEVK